MKNGTPELPGGWARCPIGDVVEPEVPQTGPVGDSFTYVDIGSIDNKLKRIVEPKSMPSAEAPSRARQCLRAHDVLVSMTRPNLNAVALVPSKLDRSIGSTGFNVLRAKGVEPRWLYYYVQSNAFIDAMSSVVQGALYPAVRPKDIRGHELPVAPFPEQARIADEIERQFTRLDAGVAALKRVQAQLKRYRASVLKAACEGRLVPTEADLARREKRDYEPADKLLARILKERRARWEADQLAKMKAAGKPPKDDKWKAKYSDPDEPKTAGLPALPDGWCWVTVDAIAFVTKLAGFEYTKFVKYDPSGDLAVIKAENAQRNGFKRTEFSRVRSTSVAELTRSRLQPGDVLMVFVGAGTGNVARVPADQPYFLGPNIGMIRPTTPVVSSAYLELYLRSPLGNRLTLDFAKAVAQPSLSMGTIRQIQVALPPLCEQERIVEEVERSLSVADALLAVEEANLARAGRLRASILRSAFGGQLAAQNPKEEPASALLERVRTEAGGAEAPPRKSGKRSKKEGASEETGHRG